MVKEFIEGWDLTQILGEGTFAEVKLLVSRSTGEACAVKEVDLSRAFLNKENDVRKEICVHKLLKHRNIVQCYGSRIEGTRQFIFLEYCSGGELFDRIEPDRGMPEFQAQGYFNQLIAGVEYLHSRGVAHRDIKPENLLLTDNDVLKISDFGMATVFRHKGKERNLERRCGTRPYMAPEVLMKLQYNAEPSDIWSCGIVLVTMLSGVLPWDQPTPDQKEFASWRDQEYENEPWKRVDNLPFSLLRKILTQHPSRRYTVPQIKNHIWVKKKFRDADGKLLVPTVISPPLKRIRPDEFSKRDPSPSSIKKVCFDVTGPIADRISASQPPLKEKFQMGEALRGEGALSSPPNSPLQKEESHSQETHHPFSKFSAFSQPVCPRDMFTATQTGTQTQGSQTHYQKLVKRMTRFWISSRKTEDAAEYLKSILDQLGYTSTYPERGIINCKTVDRRGSLLLFKIIIMECDGKVLVDMRLSRGCGMDFKKHFMKIKQNMSPIIEQTPIMFPSLLAIDSMPGIPK